MMAQSSAMTTLEEAATQAGTMLEAKSVFDAAKVKFRVLNKGPKAARIAAYVDARDVMERLDEAYGTWSNKTEIIADHATDTQHTVAARCTILAGDHAVTDFGEHVGRPGDGMTYKSAASDAFKRAAVMLGIGRELYDYKTVMGNDLFLGLDRITKRGWIDAEGQRQCRTRWEEYLSKLARVQEAGRYSGTTIEELKALSASMELTAAEKKHAHDLALTGSGIDGIQEDIWNKRQEDKDE